MFKRNECFGATGAKKNKYTSYLQVIHLVCAPSYIPGAVGKIAQQQQINLCYFRRVFSEKFDIFQIANFNPRVTFVQ